MTLRRLLLLQRWGQRRGTEGLDDGLAQGLATVDHPQPRTVGIEPALDEVPQERAHGARALRDFISVAPSVAC
jgi:hypothetical protein